MLLIWKEDSLKDAFSQKTMALPLSCLEPFVNIVFLLLIVLQLFLFHLEQEGFVVFLFCLKSKPTVDYLFLLLSCQGPLELS